MKCLAKRPEERYQHVDELVVDLKGLQKEIAVGGTAPVPQRKMLAVLPFENLGSAEDEYFADGITDEITTNLAKVSGLGVISRTSAIKYKKSDKNLRQIGSELGVDYVLEGTIRWDRLGGANRVRINCQLIRVKDDTHLWAESYDRVFEQIFELQSEVAQKVTAALDVILLEPERRALEAKPTENLEAYEYYLRGNDYLNRGWAKKDLEIALQMYEEAVELDSNFALAYAKLSQTHSRFYWHYYDRTDERLAKAKEAVDKAFKLKPDLPEAHLALGYYYYRGNLDYDRALKEFAIAQKGQPNSSDLLAAIGYVQRRQGKFEQALANILKAAELDPRSNLNALQVGTTYHYIRNYPEAERYYDRAISIAPDRVTAYVNKALLYIDWEGKTEKARKVLEEAPGKADPAELAAVWAELEVLDGNYQAALGRLLGPDKFIELFGNTNDTAAYFSTKARIYGLMNQPKLKRACYDSARIIGEKRIAARP
ncbi:MAG: tetratricopeptide repeat protein [Limisphaerales bacterium]